MKIAFFSESVADESALRILVAGILGEEIEQTNLPNRLEYRSSTHLDRNLPAVIKAVHYNSDADALVVVSDSDDSPVHTSEHKETSVEKCRLCQLRRAVEETHLGLRPVAGKDKIKVAVGVPVPAIEAWYLFGRNPQLYEAAWIRKQNGETITYDRKSLKEEIYGTNRPSIELEIHRAIIEAKRIVENGLLEDLEKAFPFGFGSLINEVKSWKF